MRQLRTGDTTDFPRFGARARAWSRFERDLRAWLETPEGRFATWRAARRPDRPVSTHEEPERTT